MHEILGLPSTYLVLSGHWSWQNCLLQITCPILLFWVKLRLFSQWLCHACLHFIGFSSVSVSLLRSIEFNIDFVIIERFNQSLHLFIWTYSFKAAWVGWIWTFASPRSPIGQSWVLQTWCWLWIRPSPVLNSNGGMPSVSQVSPLRHCLCLLWLPVSHEAEHFDHFDQLPHVGQGAFSHGWVYNKMVEQNWKRGVEV